MILIFISQNRVVCGVEDERSLKKTINLKIKKTINLKKKNKHEY